MLISLKYTDGLPRKKIVSYKTYMYIAKILVNCSEKSNRLIIKIYEHSNICETELQGDLKFCGTCIYHSYRDNKLNIYRSHEVICHTFKKVYLQMSENNVEGILTLNYLSSIDCPPF